MINSVSSSMANRYSSSSSLALDDHHREPYELVIDKTLRSRAKRIQDDTREELSKVLQRVENTLVEYEKAVHPPRTDLLGASSSATSVEYLVDIDELEEILSDKIAKFKYKQQITVFIVGQSEAIEKKNILLEQLNDFFTDQTANFDPSQIKITEFEFKLDDVKEEVDDCLETAKIMGNRLEEINESIIQYLISNTSTKQAKALIERSRKKLEKSLKDAKDDLSTLNERLKVTQAELGIRDEKIQALLKQLEMKAAELTLVQKRALAKQKEEHKDATSNNNQAGESNANRDAEINLLRSKTRKMELEIKVLKRKLTKAGLNLNESMNEETAINEDEKLESSSQLNATENDQNSKSNETLATGENQTSTGDVKNELNEFEIKEIDVVRYKYEQDIISLRKEYEQQLEYVNNRLKQAETELEKFRKAKLKQKKGKQLKANKPKARKSKDKIVDLDINEDVDNIDSILADEEKEKQMKIIDDLENGAFVEEIDLTTDDWVNVNPTEIAKRYDMLRRYATAKINHLKNEFTQLETVDREKIDKLKKQYFEHKRLWETEKLVLLNVKEMEFSWDQERSDYLDKAEVAYQLQVQAQDAAEKAIKQLEDFITEDAKIDRENAENTIQILRERSRTLTSLSVAKLNDENNNEAVPATEDQQKNKPVSDSKISQTEKSEKIQVQVENSTLKFNSKTALEKIIEYINFESSNKYTLVLNYTATNTSSLSRSNTRDKIAGSKSPSTRKRSIVGQTPAIGKNVSTPERKKSSKQTVDSLSSTGGDVNTKPAETELIDQVLTKVLNEDEAMIAELKNNVKSRSTLRSKHLAQLEENKANLNEIKSIATQKLISNSAIDQELPTNENEALNRSLSGKGDRVKAAAEAIISRVSSSKTRKSSFSNSTSNLLSHPVFLEYIKSYDIVVNFKNLITKNLPSMDSKHGSLFGKYHEKLDYIHAIEFDYETKITPQIINMTLSVDNILNEIQIVFSQIIDDMIASKLDILEKEQQIVQLKQKLTASPTKTQQDELKKIEQKQKDSDQKIKEQQEQLFQKEKTLHDMETKLKSQSQLLEEQSKTIKQKETELGREKQELIKRETEIKKASDDLTSRLSSSSIEKAEALAKVTKIETELTKTQESYVILEKKFQTQCQAYEQQISKYKSEIAQLTETIKSIRSNKNSSANEEQLMSASQVINDESPKGILSRSLTVLPPISPKQSERFDTIRSTLNKNNLGANIMFTRLDALQNIRRLKTAINRGFLNGQDLENANKLMEDYMSLQSKRFVEIVKKYFSMKKFKSIQERVEKDEFDQKDLEKMTKLQEKRSNRYMEMIRDLKEKRTNLALDLTEKLNDLERKSGIFLVKPLYSYQGINSNDQYRKINKLTRSRTTIRPEAFIKHNAILNNRMINSNEMPANAESINFMPKVVNNWNAQESYLANSNSKKAVKSASDINLLLGTPRILEIDINRVMFAQNQIATTIDPTGDKFSNNIRSYIAINRPSGSIKRDVNQNYTIDSPFASRVAGIEQKKQTSPPLPPINPPTKSKSFVNLADLVDNGDNAFDQNDFVELASIEGSESVATGNLSRANTDLN